MSFDIKNFKKAKFQSRIEAVSVPALESFFAEDDEKVFEVRGLTGEEFARVRESQEKYENVNSLIKALAGGANADEKIHATCEMLGIGKDSVPEDLVRRLEMLQLGSVSPVIDLDTAKKIFKVFPVTGFELTNKIQELSGLGMLPGEQNACGKKQE